MPRTRARRSSSPARSACQVGVVEEGDVRLAPTLPARVEVMQHRGERRRRAGRLVGDEGPEPLDRVLGRDAALRQLGEVLVADGRGAQLQEAREVHVGGVMLERDGDVARIAADHEIRGVGVQRKAVEGRVRLDEAAMRLGGERRRHLGERAGAHVEPRRDLVERRRERGPVEDQERAQHLHPRGAALRRGADHDVARTEREPVPAAAVGDDRAVARAWSL